MSFTDPSGFGLFSGLKKLFKGIGSAIKKAFKNPVFCAIVGMAAAYLTYGALNGAFIRGGNFTTAFASGFVGGAITTGSLKGALVGGATALAFYGVGSAFPSASKLRGAAPWKKGQLWFGKIVAHGTVGGTSSAAQGGSFQDGFRSAGFTQLAAPGIVGTVPGGAVGRTVAAAVVGGTASRLGGGKFANGAQTAAFAALFSGGGARQQGSSGGGVLDVVGKIWTLPNTIIGAAYGGVGHVVGEIGYAFGVYDVSPSISFGNNAIQFLDNPFTVSGTAITLGNTITYGRGTGPSYYGAYGDPSVQVGLHERAHTYQYQALGPLFLPAYLIGGGISAGNPFENAAQNYGRGTGGWWP